MITHSFIIKFFFNCSDKHFEIICSQTIQKAQFSEKRIRLEVVKTEKHIGN